MTKKIAFTGIIPKKRKKSVFTKKRKKICFTRRKGLKKRMRPIIIQVAHIHCPNDYDITIRDISWLGLDKKRKDKIMEIIKKALDQAKIEYKLEED